VRATEGTLAQVLAGEADWTIVEGDCLGVLPTIPDKAIAHVITDPPYEAEAHTSGRRVAGALKVASLDFAPITTDLRIASADHFSRLAARWTIAFCQVEAAMLWSAALAVGGAKTRRVAIWVKPDGMPQFSGDRPAMGYESIVLAHAEGRCAWNGGGQHGVFTHPCHRDPKTATGHMTEKPLPLMLELVALFTDPDELILDAFAGSGTTGVACLRLDRRFIGIEKDPKYAAVARERLRAESQGLSLRDSRAGQLAMFPGAP